MAANREEGACLFHPCAVHNVLGWLAGDCGNVEELGLTGRLAVKESLQPDAFGRSHLLARRGGGEKLNRMIGQ